MSVAAANSAVGTQPTQEQIRLAQLIEDKKHDQPEVQEIVRKVLDVVTNSNQEDALLALFDCDYDYEKAVALLIEKGHEVASEWRTATNHKITKKQQQQQKTALTKNGYGEEPDENGHQRGNDGYSYRGKSRGARSRNQQQQPNEGDSQNNHSHQQQQQNDHYAPQQRQRGESGYRGRYRGGSRFGQRTNDRNYQQQQQYEQHPQDSNVDASLPSDTTQRSTDVQNSNRRGGGRPQQQQQQWDVGNWNGETVIYSRSAKDDEQALDSDTNNVSNTSHAPTGVSNGQSSLSGVSTVNNVSELATQQKSKADFDPVEAARQIKNVIGIGQSQQQQNARTPKPLMDLKPLMGDQQAGQQQQKSNNTLSRSFGQNLNPKVSPPPPQRIPHQPVIFSDRFDGGMNKIDVQFGNLGETVEDPSSKNVSIPVSSSSSSYASYQRSEPIPPLTKQNSALSSVQNPHRTTATSQHQPSEQSSFVSSNTYTNSTRPSEQQQQQQQPVINQQRVLPPQIQQQQPSMTMKPAVPPQYAVHHQQHQMSTPNLLLQSLLYQHQQQQQEPVSLEATYDPTAFQIPPVDFSAQYFMAAPMNQQQPTQPRYLVPQPPPLGQQQHQQAPTNRQQPSSSVQTASLSTSSSSVAPLSNVNTSTTAPKKGPAVPPGIFVPTVPSGQPPYSAAYSSAYGVPPSLSGQQQTGASAYPTPYDTEHLFTNSFMQLTNPQQAQSPSGAYGSVTPPVQQQNQQQQQQQAHANNDNKTMSYRPSINENMLLLQQYQQFALQQSNNQQQGQQGAAHSPAPLNYFVGHPASGAGYSPGPQIMYAQPPAALAHQQQQASKQQGQHYSQNNSSSVMGGTDDYYGRGSSSSSSNKEAPYMYAVPAQPQQIPPQSAGQQQGLTKQQQTQQQQRAGNNVYNNQQSQQRPFQ